MKITLAQLDYIVGDFEGNTAKILSAIEKARAAGSELVCFSELSICGYPPRDFLEFTDFIDRCDAAVAKIAGHTAGIGVLLGAPVRNPVPEGKDLFNAAVFLADGKIRHIYHKSLLPTYDVFDEYRYFEPGRTFDLIEWRGTKIALTVCEDIWNIGNENPLYTICPLDQMRPHAPDLIINLSASPFSYSHAATRIDLVRANVLRYGLPMIYVNQTGAQTEILFDGGSLVVCADSTVHTELPYFAECVTTVDLEEVMQCKGGEGEQPKEKPALIYQALVCGIRDYFAKLGLRRAILGLSGGIDSAVTAVLAVAALGRDNVYALLMPSPYSSGHSVDDAKQLAENLGIGHQVIPIGSVYQAYLDLLEPHFENRPFDVTEENIQARNRGMILMAFANKLGYVLLNTTNKSEMAVGYGTLYGDMCGGISVLGDVYKTEVYELAAYINKSAELIPVNSITKAPSAELRPEQKDSDSLPEYGTLDQVLYQYIEQRKGPAEIIAMGYDKAIVDRALRLVNMNEFKRHQTAPVLRVSPKAFGIGRRMPIVGRYLS